ncbi:MAG: ABC transporter ATP-binding protein, partial [Bacilli bacterium]|nr:ABC transporter ATP-binding protein [Bacilli bacterium]
MKLLKIMGYLKRYWYVAILPPLFMLGEVYFLLLIPKTSGNIIVVGITDQNLPKVIEMSLMMLLFTTLSVVFGYLSQYFSNVASNEVANDLRIETFTKSLNMSFTNLDEFQVGKVITRVTSDTNIIRMMIRTILRTFLRAPILIFGAIFMVVTLSPKLAITLLVAIPFMFIANYIIIKKSFPKFRLVQEKLENINTFTQENLENIRVVKAFNRKEYVIDKFDEYINELQDTTIKANIITSLNSPIFQFVTNFCVVAVIYIGGLDVIAEKYNAGNIIAFLGYLSQIMMALNLISGLILEFPRAGASA